MDYGPAQRCNWCRVARDYTGLEFLEERIRFGCRGRKEGRKEGRIQPVVADDGIAVSKG
jgi:hypothetical protein